MSIIYLVSSFPHGSDCLQHPVTAKSPARKRFVRSLTGLYLSYGYSVFTFCLSAFSLPLLILEEHIQQNGNQEPPAQFQASK